MSQRSPQVREVPEDLTERLFGGAFACFSEKGFDRTTMDEIAVRSGVARATLYYYFRSKVELVGFLLERGMSMLGASLAQASEAAGPAGERLERALDGLVDLIAAYRDVCLVILQQFAWIEREWGEESDRYARQSTEPFEAIIADGVRDGTIRAVDPSIAASAIFGAAMHATLRATDEPGADIERVKRDVRALVTGGLRV